MDPLHPRIVKSIYGIIGVSAILMIASLLMSVLKMTGFLTLSRQETDLLAGVYFVGMHWFIASMGYICYKEGVISLPIMHEERIVKIYFVAQIFSCIVYYFVF